jgi:hypothetical protein
LAATTFRKLNKLILITSLSIIISVFSCKNDRSTVLLIGTWKQLDITNAGDSIIEKITFSKNSITVETIYNGKSFNKMKGVYTLSPDKKYLTTKVDTLSISYEILKLNETSLELRPEGKSKPFRLIRIE